MKNFTENTRVQVPAALHLCKLGYTYLDDITSYNPQTNILTDIFIRSVKRLNPALTDLECSQLLDKIIGILNNDDLGKEFYTMLSSNSGVKLIDFADANNMNGTLRQSLHAKMLNPVIASVQILRVL